MENPAETPLSTDESTLKESTQVPAVEPDGVTEEPTEGPKRKRGRPRNDTMPVASAAEPTTRLIPTARFREFKPGAINPGQTSSAGCNYWSNLPSWAKDQLVAYVYRTHPVLKLSPADEENEEITGTNPNIEKLAGVEVIKDELDLLNRFGCGDYHIRLNDTKRQPNAQTVCTIYFKGVGGGDYRSAPPTDKRITDIEQVDLHHPANAAYVAYLRGAGKLPEQSKKAEAERDMANIEIAAKALDSQNRIVEKLLTDRKEPQQNDAGLAKVFEIADRIAEKQAGNNPATQALLEEIRALRQDMGKSNGGALETLTVLLPILERMIGQRQVPGPDPEIAALRSSMDAMVRERIASLEKQLEAARAPISAPTTHTLKDQLEALREAKSFMEEIGGGGAKEANPVEEAARDMAPKWLRPFLPLVQPLAQAGIAYFMARAQQQGAPPQAGNVPQGFPVSPNPAMMPQPQSLPAPAPGLNPQIAQLLSSISYPLITRLNEQDPNGEDFAQWFADGYGLQTYQGVASLGQEQITAALYAFPPIAGAISTIPQAVVQRFVADFVNAKFEEQTATA